MSFFLVIKDEGRGLSNVVGPMNDDTHWNKKVCHAQGNGRLVRCFSADASRSKDEIIINVQQELKIKYTNENLL